MGERADAHATQGYGPESRDTSVFSATGGRRIVAEHGGGS